MWKLSQEMIETIWQSSYDMTRKNSDKRVVKAMLGLILFHLFSLPLEIIKHPDKSRQILKPYVISYLAFLCLGIALYIYIRKTKKVRKASRICSRLWLVSAYMGLTILYMAIIFLRSTFAVIQYLNLFFANQITVYRWIIGIWFLAILITAIFAKNITYYLYSIKLPAFNKWMKALSILTPTLVGASLLLSRLLLNKNSNNLFIYFLPWAYLLSLLLIVIVLLGFYINGNLLLSGMPQKIIRDKIYLLPEQENIGEEK
jgi:hypothetical protein